MDRVGPNGKVSKKLVQLSRWITFVGWTGPIKNGSFRTSLFGISVHVQDGGKYISLHFYGLLIASLVTTGL